MALGHRLGCEKEMVFGDLELGIHFWGVFGIIKISFGKGLIAISRKIFIILSKGKICQNYFFVGKKRIGKKIIFLFLDAWDIIFAEFHLKSPSKFSISKKNNSLILKFKSSQHPSDL